MTPQWSSLTDQQHGFLTELDKASNGPWLTPDHFMEALGTSRTGAKSVLRRLAKRGLVEAVDERSARYRITDAGRAALRPGVQT